TYSVIHANPIKAKGHKPYAVCVGRRENRQFIARLEGADPAELAEKDPADVVGRTCRIEPAEKGTVKMVLGSDLPYIPKCPGEKKREEQRRYCSKRGENRPIM
ncbi:MAG: hypothetical protein ABIH66_12475, partial [bacterium]